MCDYPKLEEVNAFATLDNLVVEFGTDEGPFNTI